MSFDLVLRGGRVIDPSQGIDSAMDVGFRDGRVAKLGAGLDGKSVRDVKGLIVTPGLIDLHTHVYWGGTSLGVDPLILARGGCTTLVDTGSAGPGNYPGFLEHVIKPSPVRIIALLNVSFAGIYGFSKRVMVGESGDLRLMAPIDAVEVALANRDTIGGHQGPGRLPRVAEFGDRAARYRAQSRRGSGLAAHGAYRRSAADTRGGARALEARATFSPIASARSRTIRRPRRRRATAVIEARKRGVIFDIGHGMGSFAFKTARAMLANGFAPDCISSDVHALCIDGPVFDLLTTMSKFLCLGHSLVDTVRAATEAPAKALRRSDLGTLRPGAAGDASVLELEKGEFDYVDSTGERLAGRTRLSARAVVMNGKLVEG